MIYALLLALALGCVGAPCTAEAQPVGKVPRLGVVFPAELPSPAEPNLAAFRQALRHLGYVEGQTVALEARYALGREERFSALITELLQLPVDLLVVGSARAAVAAQVVFLQHPASGSTWLVDDLQHAAQALGVTLQPV